MRTMAIGDVRAQEQ
jgi:hypothetical protein